MARSYRPDFTCETHEEAEDFFLVKIEAWRKEMDLEIFDLVGHSFGGFLSARYSLKHSEYIRKLILLSPLGVVTSKTEEEMDELIAKEGFAIRMRIGLARKIAKCKKISPFSILRGVGRIGARSVMKMVIKKRMSSIPDEDKPTWEKYLYQINALKGSSEYALNIMFEQIVFSKKPIYNDLDELREKVDLSFFYGT